MVEKIPIRYKRPRILTGREIWDVPDPPPEMVWEICPYLRLHKEHTRCQQCPTWEEDKEYGKIQRGCYAMASEACRVVLAMKEQILVEGTAKTGPGEPCPTCGRRMPMTDAQRQRRYREKRG